MIKHLLNSVTAKCRDLSVSQISQINNWSARHWKSRYFAQPCPIIAIYFILSHLSLTTQKQWHRTHLHSDGHLRWNRVHICRWMSLLCCHNMLLKGSHEYLLNIHQGYLHVRNIFQVKAIIFIFLLLAFFLEDSEAIVGWGDWLWKPANIKDKSNGAAVPCWKLPDGARSPLFSLCLNKLLWCFHCLFSYENETVPSKLSQRCLGLPLKRGKIN